MEMRQLEIFRALAEELHFTRAAERVHCVQSNVTTQIRALEEELGTPLFDRLAKRVILTAAGRRFLPYAEKVLSTVSDAQAAVVQDSVPSGCLCVGAPESVLNYRLPGVLIRYRKLYPKVELTFLPYWDISLVQSIEGGKMDLAVWMKDVISHPNLKSLRLRSETILFVAGRDHPLASAKKVQPHDLTGQTLLLTESGCAYRKKLDQLLALRNIRPGHVTEFSTVEAIKHCASLGMGIALLPEIVVAKELERKQLVSFAWAGPNLDIATHVVWHKDKWISPAQEAFVSLLQEILGESSAPAKPPNGKNGNRRSVGPSNQKPKRLPM